MYVDLSRIDLIIIDSLINNRHQLSLKSDPPLEAPNLLVLDLVVLMCAF